MSKCWYCNEELTTANYCEDHMGICTKCYSLMFKVSNDFVKGLTDKIADLEAKLAEKESKIETLKQRIDSIVKIYSNDFVSKDTELKELRYKVKQHNQDKISFCIEQLKWVEKLLLDNAFNDLSVVLGEIDNQIEELKKGSEQNDK